MRIGPAAVVLALAAIAGAAAGCRGKRASPDRDAGPAAAAAAPPDAGPRLRTLPLDPSVFPPEPPAEMPRELDAKLLEPGAGRRVLLRYRGGGAARELVARSIVTSHAYAAGAWTDEVTLAPVRDGFGISGDPPPPGPPAAATLTVHLRALDGAVEPAGATPAAVAAAEGYVARWRTVLAGRRADVTTDARGRITAAALLDDPRGGQSDARDELVQRWLGLAVPLPEEPVAPGARWRVRTLVRAGGVVLKQTATYRLVRAGADGWTVEVIAERIGEPQDISVPGVDGSLGELIALRRVVTGTLTVGPHDPMPLAGALTAEVSTHARLRTPTAGGGGLAERYADDRATITLAER